ncbi:MAG: hypothetical protein R6V10_02495 [bacterium]
MSPTISSKKPKPKKSKGLKSKKSMEREQFIFLVVAIAGGATVVIHLIIQSIFYVKTGNSYEAETNALKSFQALELAEQRERFEKELDLVSRVQEENLAYKRRQQELEKRENLEPQYARTETEKKMLEMQEIKNSPGMDPEKALKKLAGLAVPPRSGYLVEKKSRGYEVTVAFPYKEISKKFGGRYEDYFPGVVREIKRTAAGIMLDLFRFGKPHNIHRVYVMCQDMSVIKQKGKKDKKETRNTFVVTSRQYKADWDSISRADVEDVWRVKKNIYE